VEWHAFELHPGIPPEGQRIPWSPERIAQGRASFERLAREAGLEVGERTHWYNSDLAHEAAQWAREQEAADAFHRAIYRAYFVEDRNIGSADVLAELAGGLGLNGDDLRAALADRRYREEVLAQFQEARDVGVTAVPTFVAEGYAIVGAHPYETFRRLMTAIGQEPRAG
jgi:predicted DsbA family dithiol-disulfide isomerase